MSSRREKGFRKIKIVDSSIEVTEQDQLNENEGFCYSRMCFIISTIISICLILIIITFIIINGKKKKRIRFFTNRRINIKNTTNYTFFNENIGTKRYNLSNIYNFNEQKMNMNKTYNINDIFKNINKSIEKKESNTNENIKISIIIMNNDKKIENNFEKLFESIESQSFPDKEIFIVKTTSENNSSWENLDKFNKKAIIVKYGQNIGRLKQRYDIVNMTKGEYILFIEGDDEFSSKDVLSQIYEKALNDKLDILEYKSFHQFLQKNKIFYQPEIFSSMYFGRDNFNKLIQFHLCGKLIKRNFILNIFKEEKISPLYFNQDLQNYDQSMILLLLFRYAEKFEISEIEGTVKSCKKCEKDRRVMNIKEGMDLLLYMRFLIEHTGDNVPEKRMAANIFVNDFLNKRLNFIRREDLKMVNETLDLYLNCNKIGEQDIQRIAYYKNEIIKKLNDARLYI